MGGETGDPLLKANELRTFRESWNVASQLKLAGWPLVKYCTGSAVTSTASENIEKFRRISKIIVIFRFIFAEKISEKNSQIWFFFTSPLFWALKYYCINPKQSCELKLRYMFKKCTFMKKVIYLTCVVCGFFFCTMKWRSRPWKNRLGKILQLFLFPESKTC